LRIKVGLHLLLLLHRRHEQLGEVGGALVLGFPMPSLGQLKALQLFLLALLLLGMTP